MDQFRTAPLRALSAAEKDDGKSWTLSPDISQANHGRYRQSQSSLASRLQLPMLRELALIHQVLGLKESTLIDDVKSPFFRRHEQMKDTLAATITRAATSRPEA
ncbi:hypothetical protein BOTBODRAFT_51996 [Botryobasidium botryosum FD-172 SS1]|uniref:Uncharacterized protein n=1 Tax=Botryobasidium botryosum (strain FD-172 SS1) TaxID=930990 RepID=A0A067MY88_BOTB1|nr:hypothetical protein BOTBODRAFT_51996 [Botryobasidium botryosum FD-172 SS1]